ncbi:MAG TPA: LysM peptidoglycan-binding domain-containing protein [Ilumatobacteraceae bacterium]|jgi:LysM repeat protein
MKPNVLWVAVSAALLASCGAANGSAPDQTTLGLTSTNYVTVTQTPTTVTTTTLPGAVGNPGTVHPEEGSYVIAAGDYPSTIAKRYHVAFADLLAINGWTLQGQIVPEFPAPGATIKIPPGWTEPGTATAAPTDTSGTSTGTTPSSATTTTIAGGQSACAPGEYTIVTGDFLGKVAKKLDTTVDALNAANTSTKGYSSFYVGLKIKTPPKANC